MKRLYEYASRGMIEYDSITISYAKELTSVSLCYSQGDEFNTPLLRLFQLYFTQSQ